MNFLISFFKNIASHIGAFLTGFFIGKLEEENDQLEEERNDAVESAKGWANRPRTYDEFADRMRALAKKRSS